MTSPVYVRNSATGGTYDGTSWATAYQSLGTGLTQAVSAGAPVWVSEDHTESFSSGVSYLGGASQAASVPILCVSHTSGALATGAVIATAAGNNTITFLGFAYCDGLKFLSGASFQFGSSGAIGWKLSNCTLIVNNTTSSTGIYVGNSSTLYPSLALYNTTVQFGAVSQTFFLNNALVTWKGTASALQGAVLPGNLFYVQRNSVIMCEGVDFSALGSGKNLTYQGGGSFQATFKDCVLSSTLGSVVGSMLSGTRVSVIRSGSGASNYVEQVYSYEGSQVDNTSITLQGGASDLTTLKSRMLVTTAASIVSPFESTPTEIWIDTPGSPITATLEGIWGSATRPNDNDIWLEAEYLGASGTSLGAFVSSNATSVVTPAGTGNVLPTSAATWNNPPATSSKFKLSVTFTPQQKGFLTLRIKVAANGTFYVDPKPEISGVTVSRSYVGPTGALINETAAVTTTTVYQPFPVVRRVRR